MAFSRALLYCLPLEEIQNGYLFFEIRESSVQRLLSASAGDEIYILDGDVTLYPFHAKPNLAEIAQMEKTPLKKTDGRYKCAVSVTRSGLTYVYISEMNEINAAAQTVLNTFMALTVLLGLDTTAPYEFIGSCGLGMAYGMIIVGVIFTSRYAAKIRETKLRILRGLKK